MSDRVVDRTVPATRREDGRGQVIQGLIHQVSQKFDPDVLVAMDRRDNALIEDEIIHGAQSSAFVYSIPIAGAGRATGVTVIGARQMAASYGGIQVFMTESLSKRGSMFISRSYAYGEHPGGLQIQQIQELYSEDDFYEVTIMVHDIKTGNRIPSTRKEFRWELRNETWRKNNPTLDPKFERPHLEQIAFSKAYRNGVTSLMPQDAVLKFKTLNLALNADQTFVESVIDVKRAGVLRYAAARAIGIHREALEALTFEQIAGLSDAVTEGRQEGFLQSAQALGIVVGGEPDRTSHRVVEQQKPAAAATQQRRADPKPKQQDGAPAAADAKPATTAAATTAKPAEAAKISAPAEKKPAPAEQQQSSTPFVAFDAMGNEVLSVEGFALQFRNAVEFAEWYRQEMAVTADAEALLHFNDDGLADAMLDPAAKEILEGIGAPASDPKQDAKDEGAVANEPAPQPISMPRLAGGVAPDWKAYNSLVVDALSAIKSVEELDAWITLNQTVYKDSRLPRGRTNFSVTLEPLIEGKRKVLIEPPTDGDMQRAISIVGELEKVTTQAELDEMGASTAIRTWLNRMQTSREDITGMLREANAAASARIKGDTQSTQTGTNDGMPDHDPQ